MPRATPRAPQNRAQIAQRLDQGAAADNRGCRVFGPVRGEVAIPGPVRSVNTVLSPPWCRVFVFSWRWIGPESACTCHSWNCAQPATGLKRSTILSTAPLGVAIGQPILDVGRLDNNPDANCLPLGIHPLHTHPDPRKIIQTPKMVVIAWEANYGLRHIYMDGRKLPPQGEPQPWWYGYSVGHWEGDTLVVETNNLRGAEDGPYDGWLDVNGSPYSEQAKFTERFRRPTFGKLEIDLTVEDPKAYTKPFTVRINQR